ncbi:MAG: hypothetical protein ACKO83_14490, partial [Roseiflexaceae bacterium]
DVARGTFFNYFPRKEAVLAFLSEERAALAEANATTLLAGSAPARELILASANRMSGHVISARVIVGFHNLSQKPGVRY